MTQPTVVAAPDRLLAAAERLFLTQGYERVSVRAVNTAAGLNPAAVHYHFGSKEALVAALLERRLGPLWADRLADLTARRPAVDVAEVVDVLVAPLATLAATDEGRLLLHLLARLVLGRVRGAGFDQPWFTPDPWHDLLGELRPDLSAAAVRDRWRLAFELLLQLYGEPAVGDRSAPRNPPPPAATVAAFVAAGLDAP